MDYESVINDLLLRVASLENELDTWKSKVQICDGAVEIRGTLVVTDEEGEPSVALAAQDGGYISVMDEQGHVAFLIGAASEGQFNGFQLRDRTGEVVARLQTLDGGGVVLNLQASGISDDKSHIGLAIFENDGGAVLTVKNAQGETVFSLPETSSQN